MEHQRIIRTRRTEDQQWYYLGIDGALFRYAEMAVRFAPGEAVERVESLTRDYPGRVFEDVPDGGDVQC